MTVNGLKMEEAVLCNFICVSAKREGRVSVMISRGIYSLTRETTDLGHQEYVCMAQGHSCIITTKKLNPQKTHIYANT